VIPSMPGYGFSGKPTTAGWDPARVARAWVVLMRRLGYPQFVAQGGDWGAMVADVMATRAPPGLLGVHVSWPFTVPPDIDKAVQTGSPLPSDLSADNDARASSWTSSASTASAAPRRWRPARRRCTRVSRQRRALCGVGTAPALFRRRARGLQATARRAGPASVAAHRALRRSSAIPATGTGREQRRRGWDPRAPAPPGRPPEPRAALDAR
jgi:pimeloyl-ACP methyl ester carboxylesterase